METQIDIFEAEIEGLSVKKGKTKPPRLVPIVKRRFIFDVEFCLSNGLPTDFGFLLQTHLETSITRHKAHIIKLELILRLLDNDELSTEQVNDVKEFLDDYVERNQVDLYKNRKCFSFLASCMGVVKFTYRRELKNLALLVLVLWFVFCSTCL